MEKSNNTGIPERLKNSDAIYEEEFKGDKYTKPFRVKLFKEGSIYRLSEKRRIEDNEGLPLMIDADLRWRLEAKINKEGLKELDNYLISKLPTVIKNHNQDTKIKIIIIIKKTKYIIQVSDSDTENASYKLLMGIYDIISMYTIEEGVPTVQKK